MKGFETLTGYPDEIAEYCTQVIKEAPKRIAIADFSRTPGYKPEEIAADEAWVAAEEARFRQGEQSEDEFESSRSEQDRLLSEALEVILVQQAQDLWFGESVFLARASKYDDYKNKVDAIAEVRGPSIKEYLALGIDATRSTDEGRLRAKILSDVYRVLGRGNRKLAEVKYYESPSSPDERHRLTDVIPVVIGIDGEGCGELVTLVAQIERLRKTFTKNGVSSARENLQNAREKMRSHPAQVILLLEMSAQVDMYLALLEREPKEQQKRTETIYTKLLIFRQTIDSALHTKRKILLGNLAEDRTYLAIREITSRIRDSQV